jgi:hypothetical protein
LQLPNREILKCGKGETQIFVPDHENEFREFFKIQTNIIRVNVIHTTESPENTSFDEISVKCLVWDAQDPIDQLTGQTPASFSKRVIFCVGTEYSNMAMACDKLRILRGLVFVMDPFWLTLKVENSAIFEFPTETNVQHNLMEQYSTLLKPIFSYSKLKNGRCLQSPAIIVSYFNIV